MNKLFYKLMMTAGLLMVSGMASAIGTDEYFSIQGVYYRTLSDKTCEITHKSDIYYSDDMVIPSSVTYDGQTFTVTTIGDWAFYDSEKLTSVTIPSTVTKIGNQAFMGCTGLTSIEIPGNVTSLGDNAFEGCTGLTSVVIPNSVTSLGDYAFEYCTGLTSVTLSDHLENIGEQAFYACNHLTSITIPASVTQIQSEAFTGCIRLESITVDSNNKTYDSRDNCNAIIHTEDNILVFGCKNSTIPEGVQRIWKQAFYGMQYLKSVTFPSTLRSIEEYAFDSCTGLTSLDIPGNVKEIGEDAFAHCNGVTSLTLNEGIEEIGSYAFCDCMKITSIMIPSSVEKLGDGVFSACSGLTSIKVDSRNTVYDSRDNCDALIETETNTLLRGCKNNIPNTVTRLHEYSYNYSPITAIDIPSSVTYIDQLAFTYCEKLASVTIPNTVTFIGAWAFQYCNSLKSIVIPASVEYIETCALNGCDSLASVTFLTPGCPFAGNYILSYTPEKAVLHVLPGTATNYQSYLDYWHYTNFTIVEDAAPAGIKEIENGKLKIENSAVYGINGQRLDAAPQKGVYIKGGKKYGK